jgi:type IX secretion system PorP/SprF family membrane protein
MKPKRYLKRSAGWIAFLFMSVCFAAQAQQDAQFSQYTFNGLYINPAYAGYKQDTYVNTFYRSQWAGLQGAPQTFSLAADGSVNDTKVGLGVLMSHDRIGAQSNLTVYINYAYRLQIGYNENSRLAFGIGAGLVQNGIDGSKLNAVDEGDTYIPTGFQSNLVPDARVGILYTNDRFFVGASADNLLARKITGTRNEYVLAPVPVPHVYFTAGALFNINDETKFKPSILLKDDIGGPTSLDINAFTLLGERVWIGGTYRTAVPLYKKPHLQNTLQKSNAIIGIIEVFATDRIRVGYAFDYSLTPLQNYNYGSHEISIGIYLKPSNRETAFNKCYF